MNGDQGEFEDGLSEVVDQLEAVIGRLDDLRLATLRRSLTALREGDPGHSDMVTLEKKLGRARRQLERAHHDLRAEL